jgi:hypothetical protein
MNALTQPKSEAVSRRYLWPGIIILSVLKLWLVNAQHLTAIGYAGYDDRLFLTISDYLLKGEWLGAYNNLTLSKGPFYPIWIALVYKLGIPLLLAQHLLYVTACVIFMIAVKPLLRSHLMALILFSVLLFNPMSYCDSIMTQVIREGIYPSLTILVIACSIGLVVCLGRPGAAFVLWQAGLGFAVSAFWLTREEGVWLIPSVVLVISYTLIRILKTRPLPLRKLFSFILPFVVFAMIVGGVAGFNKIRYGVFAVSELKSNFFLKTYGSLLRVKHADWKPTIPVPEEVRKRIYAVSPAFSELRPFLEGDLGKYWGNTLRRIRELIKRDPDMARKVRAYLDDDQSGTWNNVLVEDSGEMHGGWFVWAFRDAVAAAGYYTSGEQARDYYRRLAYEVNSACSSVMLDCTSERASLMPPWHDEYMRPFLKTAVWSPVLLARIKGFKPYPGYSFGDKQSLKIFHDVTNERMMPSEFQIRGWAFSSHSDIDVSIHDRNGNLMVPAVEFLPSPDVFQYFSKRGIDVAYTSRARFDVRGEISEEFAQCKDLCYLHITSGDRLIRRLPLDGSVTSLDDNDIKLHLDFLGLKNNLSKRDTWKITALGWIGRIYQYMIPVLALLTLIIYFVLTVRILVRRRYITPWIIITSLLVAIISRLLILSVIHVTSFPAITLQYIAPAYPLLLMFVMLALIDYLEGQQQFIFPLFSRENRTGSQ